METIVNIRIVIIHWFMLILILLVLKNRCIVASMEYALMASVNAMESIQAQIAQSDFVKIIVQILTMRLQKSGT
jgi:hypothetical protein